MPFSAPILTLAWLATFELPGSTLRLCDGGQVTWGVDSFASSDPDFGSIAEVDAPEETSGDEAPGLGLTFLPSSAAAAATLTNPAFQGSPVRVWLAEVDPATGAVSGTPELAADMMIDTTVLRAGRGYRAIDMELISAAERLMLINEGNTLSARHHKSVWPGELGLDNATGVSTAVAWGVAGPPRGSALGGGGGGINGAINGIINTAVKAK